MSPLLPSSRPLRHVDRRPAYYYKHESPELPVRDASNLAPRQPKQHRDPALVLFPVLPFAPLFLCALLQQRYSRRVIQQQVRKCRREKGEVGEIRGEEGCGTGRGGEEGVVPYDGETAPEGDFPGVTTITRRKHDRREVPRRRRRAHLGCLDQLQTPSLINASSCFFSFFLSLHALFCLSAVTSSANPPNQIPKPKRSSAPRRGCAVRGMEFMR